MIDIETQQPLRISNDGDAGPYLMVPLEQLDDVVGLLYEHHVAHQVDRDAIELDGRPVIAIVNFGRGTDPAPVQALLDAA